MEGPNSRKDNHALLGRGYVRCRGALLCKYVRDRLEVVSAFCVFRSEN
jgi:hypothetical protein